jgi:hypothetical protein
MDSGRAVATVEIFADGHAVRNIIFDVGFGESRVKIVEKSFDGLQPLERLRRINVRNSVGKMLRQRR